MYATPYSILAVWEDEEIGVLKDARLLPYCPMDEVYKVTLQKNVETMEHFVIVDAAVHSDYCEERSYFHLHIAIDPKWAEKWFELRPNKKEA